MRRLLVPVCLSIILLGCCKPVIIQPVCPPPPPVKAPILRSAVLPAGAQTVAVVEAYVLDLADWVAYARTLETLLDGYRPPPATAPPSAPPPSRLP